jgi:hypothetical protein
MNDTCTGTSPSPSPQGTRAWAESITASRKDQLAKANWRKERNELDAAVAV